MRMHIDCLDALAIHRDGQSLAARLLRPRAIEHRAAAKGDPGRASRNLQKMSSRGHFPSSSILICSRVSRVRQNRIKRDFRGAAR
jgi:hypothetical protein